MKVLVALLFVVGLCMTGSDGKWFPWTNLLGLVIFISLLPLTKKVKDMTDVQIHFFKM